MRKPVISPAGPAAQPIALAVDLGSHTAGIWATHHGVVSARSTTTGPGTGALVSRGRIADADGCASLLTRLAGQFPQPVDRPRVVVACRPVLSTDQDDDLIRRAVDAAFAPRRTLLIDTVRAAAIGSGADAGTLLIADVGAELTEVALLGQSRVTAARRTDAGTRDLAAGATADLLADIVAGHVDELRGACPADDMRQATARGLLLVGDGARHPGLRAALAEALDMRVHRGASPHTTALRGAGLAARSAMRHPAHR